MYDGQDIAEHAVTLASAMRNRVARCAKRNQVRLRIIA